MKDFFKGLTVLFFYTSVVLRPLPAEALMFGASDAIQLKKDSRPFTEKEVSFLAHYVSYLKYSLYLHGLEIKKKITCLGYPELANFYSFEFDENDPVHQTTKEALNDYIESEECQLLIKETLPDIIRTFLEMRIQLSLHQAKPREIESHIYNKQLAHDNSVDLKIDKDFLDCEYVQNPIFVKETRLCFENFLTMINPHPSHLVEKSDLLFIDDLVSRKDLPEVSDLQMLTWPEVQAASLIFQDKYVNNEVTNYSFSRPEWPELKAPYELEAFLEAHPLEKNLRVYGLEYARYMSARDYVKPPGLFKDYPEESAPFKYTKALAKYPFLAFFKPELEEVSLACDSDGIVFDERRLKNENLENLCKQYLEMLGGKPAKKIVTTKRSVAEALEVTLKLNEEMIASIDRDYPVADLKNEKGELLKEGRYKSLKTWSTLMKMQNVNEHFFSLYDFEDEEQRFVEILDRRETLVFWGSLAGAVGAGLVCGFIGNFWGAVGCLTAAGFGVNVAFYAQAYRAYEDDFGMYFAVDVAKESEGELLTLIEFGTLESSLQNLYIEKLFLGIGTGVGDVLKRARRLGRFAQ